MVEWANYSSPSSASPDSGLPYHVRLIRGGSGVGVETEAKENR